MNLREKEHPIYIRLFRRLFARNQKRDEMKHILKDQQEEIIQTPMGMMISNFLANKIAMVGLVVFVSLFLMVIFVPWFCPIQRSYQEVTQQNISPGRNLLSVPKKLQGQVDEISVGSTFSVGVSTKGEVYLWGKYGKSLKEIPEGMGRVKVVSAGVNHILALNEKGKLFAWGSNRFGQTELPKEVQELTDIHQIVAGNQYSIAVSAEGKVYFWGNQNLIDFDAGLWQGQVQEVAANTSVVLALLKNGEVTVLGKRESAYSAIPNFKSRVIDLALTSQEAYALDEEGTVYRWGSGTSDVFCLDENKSKTRPKANQGSEQIDRFIRIEAGRYHVIALSNTGGVYAWGEDTFDQTTIPKRVDQESIKDIYCGYYQNYAVTESGKVLTWGLKGYLFGTDGYGRDIFTRLMSGGRLTMTIGAVAVVIQTLIGIFIGGIAGYCGGMIDNLLMRFTEVINSLPFLPFAMILSAIIGNKLTEVQRIYMIMVVLGVLSWPGMARLVRAQILSEKSKEFVTAAKAMGIRQGRIIFRHILPNVMTYVIVSATASFAASMLTESSLSFLGFGVVEPSPTWGNMLTGSQSSVVIGTYWWRWVFPALALSLATISINLIGDGLRDAIDPKSSE